MKNLGPLIRKFDIYLLTGIPIILGILIVPLGCKLLAYVNIPCNKNGLGIVVITSSIIMSIAGFAQIYKRESPGFHSNYPIRGKLAVFIGWIWVIFCWGGVIFILYSYIK